ncbi:MAG: ATP-dependent helicase [Chloroflexota bacterium]
MANLDEIYDIDNRVAAFENHMSGVLVSLAGPGTGKTYSLLKRVKVLTDCGEIPDSICYLTFTKEISNAFIADFIDTFGLAVYVANKPRISTLHSFACRLIRNQGFRVSYDGELYFMSITNAGDSGSNVLLSDLFPLTEGIGPCTIPQLRKTLEQTKTAWRDCVDPISLGNSILKVLPICLDLLRAYRLVDWDQTIPMAHDLLVGMQEQPKWISQIEHYLIDEYQDFNRAEQKLIDTLSATAKSMVIVGDDDQSLYRDRGGSPEGLRELWLNNEHDRVSLLLSRRCKSEIVKAANTFLTAMRVNPRLLIPFEVGGEVLCFRFKSSKAEIEYLAKYLSKCIDELPENPTPKDGTMCLFPSWRALNVYFDRLSSLVPCVRRKPISCDLRLWLQRVLELVCHPGQRFLERLILEEYRDVKPRHKREMVKIMLQQDISPAEALDVLIANEVLTGLAASQATGFCEFCQALASQNPGLISEQISERLGIDVQQINQHLETFLQCLDETKQEEAISLLCDGLIPDSACSLEDPKSILFLTMHGSKGLTKNTIVMPGLEKAWLPGEAKDSDLEEKRRLFYVALTRATDHVLLTYPKHRARGDKLNYKTPGRGQVSSFVVIAGIGCSYHD